MTATEPTAGSISTDTSIGWSTVTDLLLEPVLVVAIMAPVFLEFFWWIYCRWLQGEP